MTERPALGERALRAGDEAVVLGLGLYGVAVARALTDRGISVTAIEDRPRAETDELAVELGVRYLAAPELDQLDEIVARTAALFPSPGVPETHPAFAVAARVGTPIRSEFDLARWWDERPIAAVTGTDGKTTVTLLAAAMLEASGVRTAAVGNTETPLVAVIDDPAIDVFVVEASSFRLAHTERFHPRVAAWLNWGPDHLDVHRDLPSYEAAKARIWAHLPPDGVAIAAAADPVVMRHVPGEARTITVATSDADARVEHGRLVVGDVDLVGIEELPRRFDHDVTNTLFAAAIALEMGGSPEGIRRAIATHALPPHRVQYVATIDEVGYYNDSKATVPHAVVAAVRGFDSVVLIAGGRNKGIDLGPIADPIDRIRAVVAVGEAADEIVDVFEGRRSVQRAADLDDAVRVARELARPGDAVLLSPGCASYDSHRNYEARGEHFMRAVAALTEEERR